MDWEDIKVLGQLAKSGTVRSAAKAMRVHHSTVSRRIEALEHAAGTRLFDRTPEGYVLTEAGEHLARSAKAMEAEVLGARRRISGGDREMVGRIRVTMAAPLAVHAFAPRLGAFFTQYPGLDVEIIETASMVDLARRKADIAVRLNNNPPDQLFGKRLFTYCNTVYASPDYLARHDLVRAPETGRWIGWDGSFARHPRWTEATPFRAVPVRGNFPSIECQAALARAGAGLAMLPCFIGDPDPGLVRASDAPPLPGLDIWILTHADLRRTARIRAFMKFAEEVLLSNKALFLGEAEG